MKNLPSAACAAWLALACSATIAGEAAGPLAVGQVPPTYVGRDIGGPDVHLDPTSGKAYVVSFWASWCAPCLQELPVLANIQAAAGRERMQVIAVNIDTLEVYRKLRRKISEAGLTSTFDPGSDAQKSFGVSRIPHMVIVGRDGRISDIRVGYAKASHEELAQALNKALAVEPAKATP